EDEKAADSLGYVLMSKTDYDTREFVSTLAKLKEVDDAPFKDTIQLTKFFRCASSDFDFAAVKPYKANSLFKVVKDTSEKTKLIVDSLRTHPDTDKRIAFIND